jgi:hypothetical protein
MEDPASNSPDIERRRHRRALLSEIRMLVDFVAASSVRTLGDIAVNDPGSSPPSTLDAGQLLVRLDEIDERIADNTAVPSDFALIQVTRDALGRLVRPASGLTVAYTALVVGNRRGQGSESRATLAQEAYPGLVAVAAAHRWAQRVLLMIAVLATIVAVWESAKVALGKSLLQNLDILRTQQTAITAEKARLESSIDKLPDGSLTANTIVDHGYIPLAAFALCDRRKALRFYVGDAVIPKDDDHSALHISDSPLVRDVCERDSVLATNLSIAHNGILLYRTYWPGMVGRLFDMAGQIASIPCRLFACSENRQVPLGKGQSDVEFTVAPTLMVWGNYILPVIFGFLGASIFVILDFFGKIRDSRLDPRDKFLSWIRLVLGLVTGSAVGLFFSAYGTPPSATGAATELTGSLTLSAAAVAFLAGFGVPSQKWWKFGVV